MKVKVKLIGVITCLIILCGSSAFGAELHLKNGDKITGQFVNQDESAYVFKTEALGQISVKKNYVKTFMTDEDIVAAKMPVYPQWKRKVSIGYNESGGNTENSKFNTELSLNRKSEKDEWSAKLTSYFSSANGQLDGKKFYGSLRYAHSRGEEAKWFDFYKIEGSQDRFSDIDYRVTPSAGFGYWFLNDDDFKLMAETAVGYEYTNFRSNQKSEGNMVLVPRVFLEKKLWDGFTFTEDLTYYPSLEDLEDYRLKSVSSLVTKLNDQLSWRLAYEYELDAIPASGREKADYQVISAIDYNF